MSFLVFPLALIPLGAIMYAALSKKSGSRTRIAALIALGLMLLSVIVCAILIFGGSPLVKADGPAPVNLPPGKTVAPGSDLWIILGFIAFLILLFVVVAILSFRERRRQKAAQNTSGPKAA
jgi:hypothetical protein